MKRLALSAAMLLAALVPSAPAWAGNICSKPALISLADYALKHRTDLSRFRQRQHGAIAAYLAIHYKAMAPAETLALLTPMIEAKVSRADELASAWSIYAFGPTEAASKLKPQIAAMTPDYSVLRALALQPDRQALWAMLASMSESEAERAQTATVYALLDQPDTFKEMLAKEAEKRKLPGLAAGLAATQKDSGAWDRFAGRLGVGDMLDAQVMAWRSIPPLVGNPAFGKQSDSTETRLTRMSLGRITQAAAAEPERDFLMAYVNQSGRVEFGLPAAEAFLAESARRGQADPLSMDESWLLVYRATVKAAGARKDVDDILASVQFSGNRHYKGSLRDVLDLMLAVEALGPDIAGKGPTQPLPADASPSLAADWPLWVKIAEALWAGYDPALYAADPKQREFAAELLYAAGKPDAVATLIAASPADETSVSLAEDFAARLDRSCDKHLVTAGEAVVLPDTPLFKFDVAAK